MNHNRTGKIWKKIEDADKKEKKKPNTNGRLKQTDYDRNIEIENEISDITGLVRKINYNTKITEIENKMPNITGLRQTSM